MFSKPVTLWGGFSSINLLAGAETSRRITQGIIVVDDSATLINKQTYKQTNK